jgi:protein-tyrosine phosphatase
MMNKNGQTRTTTVLCVCLGNICRSPLAEAALRDIAERAGLEIVVDSAGTGDWHIGHAPDPRARDVAQRLGGLDIGNLHARQVSADDFHRFDHILAMDKANLQHLRSMRPDAAKAQLSLLLDHLPGQEGKSVADPYYGEIADFEACWWQIYAAAEAFLNSAKLYQ